MGVIAQEIEKEFPELVYTADDIQKTKSVNYEGLVAPLIEAVKEIAIKNKNQENRLQKLEKENNLLKNRLDKIEKKRL